MDFKFSKDQDGSSNQVVEGRKGNQNGLLILLFVLVGGFAYIYFFTGLIKPLKVQPPAEVQVPQVVKNPLPARDGDPAKSGATAATEAKKDTASTQPSPGKNEPVEAAKSTPAASPAAKETPKPKEEAKKIEPLKPTVKKAMPIPPDKPVGAKAEVNKTVPTVKKQPVVAEKNNKTADKGKAAGSAVKAVTPTAKPEKKPAAESVRASSGSWTVLVGSYLLEDALAEDLVRVRRAGLNATVLPGGRKKAQMNRLLLGQYDDRSTAKAELDKLKRHTSDAFIMDHDGKLDVYAGSYLLDERALSEKTRLAASGYSLTVKRTEVAIPSKNLTVGVFSDRKAAEAVLKKLKAAGVKATLIRQ